MKKNMRFYVGWVHKNILQTTVSRVLSFAQCTPYPKEGQIPICNASSSICYYSNISHIGTTRSTFCFRVASTMGDLFCRCLSVVLNWLLCSTLVTMNPSHACSYILLNISIHFWFTWGYIILHRWLPDRTLKWTGGMKKYRIE